MALPILIPIALAGAAKATQIYLQHLHDVERDEIDDFEDYLVWFESDIPMEIGDEVFMVHWGPDCMAGDRQIAPARDYVGEVVGVSGKVICVEVYGEEYDDGLLICCHATGDTPMLYEKADERVLLRLDEKVDLRAARQLVTAFDHVNHLNATIRKFEKIEDGYFD